MSSNKGSLNRTGIGCMAVAVVVGFVLGLNAGGRVLPPSLNWVFAFSFAVFFAILAFLFTGMRVRRDRGVVSETFMAIPSDVPASLKQTIEEANPPAHLSSAEVGALDADLAELSEMANLLRRQPRAGTQPALKERIEELAQKWLDERSLDEWLTSVEPD